MAVCSWGRAGMPSDVEPEDLFACLEWARAVGGVGPRGWPVVAARLAGWGCMIGSMPRMSVRAQAHLPWLLDWCERAAWTSTRALAGQRPWWSSSASAVVTGLVRESSLDFIQSACWAKALVEPMARRDRHCCTKNPCWVGL